MLQVIDVSGLARMVSRKNMTNYTRLYDKLHEVHVRKYDKLHEVAPLEYDKLHEVFRCCTAREK